MRFEWVMYRSHNRAGYLINQKVLKSLPESIKAELIQDSRLVNCPSVEEHKKEVTDYLDHAYGIGRTKDIRKERSLEIDKQEIGQFTHFRVGLKILEIDREFFVHMRKATCESFYCYVGRDLLAPVRMKAQRAARIGIAELGFGAFAKRVYLVISAELKDLFDAEGVTGLEYEPIEIIEGNSSAEFAPPFMARISNVVYEHADDVMVREWACQEHRVIWTPIYSNLRLSRKTIDDADFYEIGGVIAKGETYNYKSNQRFVVTRKVLELLLNKKVKGLARLAFILKSQFIPVRFDEVTVF